MTGMTRFHQASVFSALNNLTDISLDSHFGTLTGFTEDELVRYFAPHLRAAAETLGVSGVNELIDEMAEMYGGFCFDRFARTQVFHPGSVLRFLNAPELGFVSYWRESGQEPACLKHARSSGLLDAPEASLEPLYADLSELALPADGRGTSIPSPCSFKRAASPSKERKAKWWSSDVPIEKLRNRSAGRSCQPKQTGRHEDAVRIPQRPTSLHNLCARRRASADSPGRSETRLSLRRQ